MTRQRSGWRGWRWRRTAAVVASAVVLSIAGFGCERQGPKETPEGTIHAMGEVVRRGKAARLGEFLYADTPEMRRLYRRTGVMLGHVQDLARAIGERFPGEVAALRAEAEKAAAEGKSQGLVSRVVARMGPQGGRRGARQGNGGRGRADPKEAQASLNEYLKQLMADPYAWAEQAETRLTTAFVTDDTVALLWDGEPVLAPLGLTMRRAEDERWYVVLPTGVPGVSAFMPRTPDQFKIFGSLIATVDNLVIDLRRDVEAGRVRDLNDLSTKAGEKAFLPMAAAFYAYGSYTAHMEKDGKAAKGP